ncbi:MAG: efflux RND transporter periplasmic adaptor subunit [Nitrosomonadales bacterium]|nr:efflux RND transporter periplasmic adaptor subunit [Nitrosomonadales bacterium]
MLKFFAGRAKYLAALLALGLIAFGWWQSRPQPVSVALTTVQRGTVEATLSNTRAGTVKACHRAKLAPPAGGQIAQLRVKKGERVVAGQVLLELWNHDLQAQAQLAEEQLHSASTRAQEVCSVTEEALRNAQRSRELRDQGFISAQQLDRTQTDAESKTAACAAARNEIVQARSRIALARAGLDRMVLRAPFDGIVADISGELGEYATPSPPGIPTPPAIDLIDDRCLFVSAPIDEVDAGWLKLGQTSRITLDAIKVKTFAGRVKRIAPYVIDLEKQARTVEVEVEFTPPPSDSLLVGYSADVEIVHEARANVLRIPTQALMDGKRVLLLNEAGVLEARTVTTGLGNWSYTEITGGLQAGDRLVISLDREGVKAGAHATPDPAKK